MSRITAVTLLLIILVDNFYDTAVTASPAVFRVTEVHIRKCGCRLFPNKSIKCRSRLLPKGHVKKEDLVKCFCSKRNQDKFPEFKANCRSWIPETPISMF